MWKRIAVGMTLGLVSAGSAFSQASPTPYRPGQPQLQPRVPNAKPTMTPYINLLNGNSTGTEQGLLYLGIVRPQIQNLKYQKQQAAETKYMNEQIKSNTNLAMTGIQMNQQLINGQVPGFGQAGAQAPVGGVGGMSGARDSSHRGAFMQRQKYFPRSGGGGAAGGGAAAGGS